MKILVLKSKGCMHCQEVINNIEKLSEEFKGLDVEIIDVLKNPEYLEKYPIMSSPGVVIDGELVFEGAVDIDKLREKIREKLK